MLSGTIDIHLNTQVEGYINHLLMIKIRWYITYLIDINWYSIKVKQFGVIFNVYKTHLYTKWRSIHIAIVKQKFKEFDFKYNKVVCF